jgi:hypothetical protein
LPIGLGKGRGALPVKYSVNVNPLFIVIYFVKRQIVPGGYPAVFLVPFIGLVYPGVISGIVKTFLRIGYTPPPQEWRL